MKNTISQKGIPISVSLDQTLENQNIHLKVTKDKKRLLFISTLAVIIGACISFIAKVLVHLINLFSNISFHGHFNIGYESPATNTLGIWVIVIPAIGGVIVGLMALYGSKAIRGHGIPEAMEQVLTNQSKIRPSITYLKPLSSAVSIGTGGPFGAEGPIIATGGALGSTLGQLLKITHYERKILLAAGATAGMAAIFGSPIAAIFLAIELLLFEFSPKSIIPVALACITGAAGHHLFFEAGPVFPMPFVQSPTNAALASYSVVGIIIGLLAALVTKIVYFIEDAFEKLPVHWMWWPAIGGLAVGIVGYFAPRTLGVGYSNITDILSGTMALNVVLSLCLMKFLSWAIALGSGTSGGTLAPLLTIGAATGALLGAVLIRYFPEAHISIQMAALIGMSAMFAGASRAVLTSIVFAIETTAQSNALLPLLAACVASYLVSYLLMENTIMTEKIARRGIKTPHSYEPDVLDKVTVSQVTNGNGFTISNDNTINEVREWLEAEKEYNHSYFIIADCNGVFKGILSSSNLFSKHHDASKTVETLIKRYPVTVTANDTLRHAVDLMARENVDVLPVISDNNKLSGILSYKDILSAYKIRIEEHEQKLSHISLKRGALKILLHGKNKLSSLRETKKETV
jgi:chloride channel protein, CIC family